MADDDLRQFIREMLQRNERFTDLMAARLEDQRLAMVGMQGEIADVRMEMAEQRKQIQANTQAVLSVLDRLS